MPFSILGGYICFCSGRELYEVYAGFLALTLWCFCPYVLGHGSLITPDVPAAALGLAVSYVFWRWLREPSWELAFFAGLVLGLAELTKFTLLVFYPLWLLMWGIYRVSQWNGEKGTGAICRNGPPGAAHKIDPVLFFPAMVARSNPTVVDDGTQRACSQCRLQLRGFLPAIRRLPISDSNVDWCCPLADVPKGAMNRFAGTWLGEWPVPLPKNYLQGIDTQKLDFERGRRSYLHGQWKDKGGW